MRITSKWAGLLAAAATVVTVAAVPPAQAAPQPLANAPATWRSVRPSRAVAAAAHLGAKARNSTNTTTLDYRRAIKAFRTGAGDHTTWRRQYAAGWLKAGGHLSHITAGERSKVVTVERSAFKPRNAVQPLAPNCRGSNRVTNPHNQGGGQMFAQTTSYFWDSCRVNRLLASTATCVAVIGFGAVFIGPNVWIKAAMAFGVLVCALTGTQVTAARSNSTLAAVVFDVTYQNNLISDPWIYTRVRPQ